MLLPRVRAKFSRDALVAGASVLYALCRPGAGACAEHRAAGRGDARDRRGLDLDSVGAAGVRADDAAAVGARARAWPRSSSCSWAEWRSAASCGGRSRHAIGIPAALTISRGREWLLAIALTWRFKLGRHEVLDFTPSMDWPLPVLAETPEPDAARCMVTIDYRIQPDKRAEFVAAMQAVREMRRRNGAYFWQLFHDSGDPTRFIECFMDESWLEHLRQHERVSVADREIQRRAKQYLVEGESTRSSHWLAEPGS